MWVYSQGIERCGGYLRVMPQIEFSVFEKPGPPSLTMLMPRELKIEEMQLVHRFEVVSLLVAIDEDSLEVYWGRKTS